MSSISLAPNRYLQEIPLDTAKQLERRAKLYDLASKVTLAAVFAIATGVLAISFISTSALPFWFSAVILASIIASPFLIHYSQKFSGQSQLLRSQATVERGVAEQWTQISSWKKKDVEDFLNSYKIPLPSSETLSNLAKYTRKDPYTALLPLIARFQFWQQVYVATAADAVAKIQPEGMENEDTIRHMTREIGYEKLEEVALPAGLQGAVALQYIATPLSPAVELTSIGRLCPKSMAQRLAEQIFDKKDVYFQFKDPTKAPLATSDICGDFPALRQKLFC